MSTGDSESTSPWSPASDSFIDPSESVPPPDQIVWDAPESSTTEPDPAPAATEAESTNRSMRQRWLVAGGVVAIAVLVGVVWRTGSEPSTSGTPVSLPDAEADVSVTTDGPDADSEPTTVATPPTVSSQTSGENISGYVEVDDLDVDLPDAVARITQPTELVMQTADGLVHTLSLPSGRVRTVPLPLDPSTDSLDFGDDGRTALATPTAAFFGGWTQDLTVVPRQGEAFVIDPEAFGSSGGFGPAQTNPAGWVTDADGSAAALVGVYNPTDDSYDEFTIADDGTVTPVQLDRIQTFTNQLGAFGDRYLNDAGGVYRIASDGATTRLSTGTALALAERFALLRECDDERTCQFFVADLSNGERQPVEWPDDLDDRGFGLTLSPDGRVLASRRYGSNPGIVLFDLFDGTSVRTDDDGSGVPSVNAWAPDGTGLFVAPPDGDGIAFLDLATGETASFGEALGRVVAIAARYPDRELDVEIALLESALTVTPAPQGPTGLHLATYAGIGQLTLLDVDAAIGTGWTTRALPGPDSPQLFANSDMIGGYSTSDDGLGFVSEYGSMTGELDGGVFADGSLFPGPSPTMLWANRTGAGTDAVTMFGEVVDIDAPDPGFGTVLDGDSRGGLLVAGAGDIYIATRDADPQRLTTGEVLAIGFSTALVRECDQQLVCAVSLIDRETGERTVSELAPLESATGIDSDRVITSIGSMSPDGATALINRGTVIEPDGLAPDGWFFIDLESGELTEIDPPDAHQPIVWSDDGAYGAYLSDGALRIYERDTSELIEVDGIGGNIRAMTDVPAEFGE